MGAEEGKIILTGTAFGNRFTLLDTERNVPGSAAVGRPERITYQQVGCDVQMLESCSAHLIIP